MKFKSLLTGAAALGLVSAAYADVTIDITGATAFRSAAHNAILAGFNAGTGFRVATSGSSSTGIAGATQVIFEGNYPGITGTTTVRTHFTGSVEGILALTKPTNASYKINVLPASALTGSAISVANGGVAPTANWSQNASVEVLGPKFAFSDVAQASTPAKTPKLGGGPVGIIVFAPVINKGTPSEVTNITTQQFRQLALSGKIPLRFMTGNDSSTGSVYLTGRNDFSGTRTAFLAETGHGVSAAVKQYVMRSVTGNDTTGTIDTISLAPVASVVTANLADLKTSKGIEASGVFTGAGTKDGNGGYNSGGKIAALMGRTTNATTVVNSSTGTTVTPAAPLYLASWLGTSDTKTSLTNGGKILSYNGEILSDLATSPYTLGTTDRAKVRNGKYTAWSYEQLFYSGTLSGDTATFHTDLRSRMTASVIGTSGLALSEMKIPSTTIDASKRTTDGGIVAP